MLSLPGKVEYFFPRYVKNGFDEIDKGDYATLVIEDTGIGISPEDMERIFEPFYTKKTMGRSGTGLGMAVVWGAVKDHRGYIDIRSKEGKGTEITLYFPIITLSTILPIAIGGVGIREWTAILLLRRFGVPESAAFNTFFVHFVVVQLLPALAGTAVIGSSRWMSG